MEAAATAARHEAPGKKPTARVQTDPAGTGSINRKTAGKSMKQKDSTETRRRQLATTADAASTCTACSLHENRTKSVFGSGSPTAALMWVGEAPGPDEDRSGQAFTGRSGELLDRIIEAMKLARDDVYLTNVVTCRLDDARRLTKTQIDACRHHLEAQIATVQPKVIIPLGSTAWGWFAKGDKRKMAEIRGAIYRWREQLLVPTYHPAFLLRKPEHKREVWEDTKRVIRLLDPRFPEPAGVIQLHEKAAEPDEPEPLTLF